MKIEHDKYNFEKNLLDEKGDKEEQKMTDEQRDELNQRADWIPYMHIKDYVSFTQDVCSKFNVTPFEFLSLFSRVEILCKDGKWVEFMYGHNYSIELKYDDVLIHMDECLCDDIKANLDGMTYHLSGPNVKICRYTGYNVYLNCEGEEICHRGYGLFH